MCVRKKQLKFLDDALSDPYKHKSNHTDHKTVHMPQGKSVLTMAK